MVISRGIIRVTPFEGTYNSSYNLLTKSPAPSSRVFRCLLAGNCCYCLLLVLCSVLLSLLFFYWHDHHFGAWDDAFKDFSMVFQQGKRWPKEAKFKGFEGPGAAQPLGPSKTKIC